MNKIFDRKNCSNKFLDEKKNSTQKKFPIKSNSGFSKTTGVNSLFYPILITFFRSSKANGLCIGSSSGVLMWTIQFDVIKCRIPIIFFFILSSLHISNTSIPDINHRLGGRYSVCCFEYLILYVWLVASRCNI